MTKRNLTLSLSFTLSLLLLGFFLLFMLDINTSQALAQPVCTQSAALPLQQQTAMPLVHAANFCLLLPASLPKVVIPWVNAPIGNLTDEHVNRKHATLTPTTLYYPVKTSWSPTASILIQMLFAADSMV